MNDCKIYDKATSTALDALRSAIAEIEGGAQEDRAAPAPCWSRSREHLKLNRDTLPPAP